MNTPQPFPAPVATREYGTNAADVPAEQRGWAERWAWEILLVLAVGAWIAYELYGRAALAWLEQYTFYIRVGGGIVVILYLWWQLRGTPIAVRDTMDLAKQLLRDSSTGGGTREKRHVTGLMKKKVAAGQQWKCGACHATLDETFEVDHKVALFNGGSNEESNLLALCPHCHRKKTVAERLV